MQLESWKRGIGATLVQEYDKIYKVVKALLQNSVLDISPILIFLLRYAIKCDKNCEKMCQCTVRNNFNV
jgi:uncharacterized protein YggT (Ycf19 family)